jgi:hypothetical protein
MILKGIAGEITGLKNKKKIRVQNLHPFLFSKLNLIKIEYS